MAIMSWSQEAEDAIIAKGFEKEKDYDRKDGSKQRRYVRKDAKDIIIEEFYLNLEGASA